MRGSPPGWGSPPTTGFPPGALHSPWAGAANASSVLPVRRCYALQKSRIRPFPFSAVTASKQEHLHAGVPNPSYGAGGDRSCPGAVSRTGFGGGSTETPRCFQEPPQHCQGRCREKGSLQMLLGAAGCGVHHSPALSPGYRGLHCCPPSPARACFACGSSTARPPALSGAAPLGAKAQGGKSFPVTSLWQPSLLLGGKEERCRRSWYPAWEQLQGKLVGRAGAECPSLSGDRDPAQPLPKNRSLSAHRQPKSKTGKPTESLTAEFPCSDTNFLR